MFIYNINKKRWVAKLTPELLCSAKVEQARSKYV